MWVTIEHEDGTTFVGWLHVRKARRAFDFDGRVIAAGDGACQE